MTIISRAFENTHTYEYWNTPLETKICVFKIIFQCERCHNIAFGIIEGGISCTPLFSHLPPILPAGVFGNLLIT